MHCFLLERPVGPWVFVGTARGGLCFSKTGTQNIVATATPWSQNQAKQNRDILVWRSERQKGDYFLTPSAKSYEILYGDSSEKYENIQERKMAWISWFFV